ncbi:hypothetical protein LPB41_12675 [Thalassospira sp. MA62]|nr:hypothetical protein [Thalassospira sp. MA62]
MTENTSYNICIVHPPGYIHSQAFSELAELLMYSIRETGHPAGIQTNQFVPDAINIIVGAHLLDVSALKSVPEGTVILNTEQLTGVFEKWRDQLTGWFQSGLEIWDYSPANIDVIKGFGAQNVRYLPIGYQKELQRIDITAEQGVDVLFYGSLNDRRRKILSEIEGRGLNLKVLMGVYGKERDQWIARSKVILNHHFYESQIFEIVRVSYLLTNAKAVVAEVNPETVIDDRFRKGVIDVPYDGLVNAVCELIEDPVKRKAQQRRALNSIIKYPQVDFTRPLVECYH